jgi:hypothetical protein
VRTTDQIPDATPEAPRDVGVLRLIARRPDVDLREVVTEAQLDVDAGLIGDNWQVRGSRSTPDGSADRDAQITLMSARAAQDLIGDVERWPLAGDQLFVDLDISETNLPAGTTLAIGEAEIVVSPKPHTGCVKFAARFGKDALRLVSTPEGRELRLRGMNARITKGGTVRAGDTVRVVRA